MQPESICSGEDCEDCLETRLTDWNPLHIGEVVRNAIVKRFLGVDIADLPAATGIDTRRLLDDRVALVEGSYGLIN